MAACMPYTTLGEICKNYGDVDAAHIERRGNRTSKSTRALNTAVKEIAFYILDVY